MKYQLPTISQKVQLVMLVVETVAVFSLIPGQALAQKTKKPIPKPASIAPADSLKPGWEEIDKRLIFLMVRLANVEASLDAVEKRVGLGARQSAVKAGEAKRAEKGNEMMDRKGGGPVKWSEFYGRTAEKFFYHPVDRNTTYHTTTILSQQSPGNDNQSADGIPSRQGLPVHQRPPQFDYIYKANRDAQARAEREASDLRNKVDALLARRRQLEDEQSALWCQIAFRAVSRYDLPKKPLYRFEPLPGGPDTDARNQAEALKAAAIFMRRALSIVEIAEQDQAKAFGSIKVVVSDACDKLDDAWLHQGFLTDNAPDTTTPVGKFAALTKKLKDVSENLSDSYEVSIDGDRFKDEVRKDTFRGLLQESLVDYAQIVLALNEMSLSMASEWKTKPDLNTPLKFVSLEVQERGATSTVENSLPEEAPFPVESPVGRPQKQVNDSIKNGLRWLASQQQGDGSWTFSGGSEVATSQGMGVATALVVLPFVRRGHSHREGEHRAVMEKALAFIESRLRFGDHGCKLQEDRWTMYGHALVTMALCETYSRSNDQQLQRYAQGAVDFTVYAQDPINGGWRYQPRQAGDTSVLGWQVQALKDAHDSKLRVPPKTLRLANTFLDTVQRDGGTRYAYEREKQWTPTMSAVGLYCRACLTNARAKGLDEGRRAISTIGPSPLSAQNLYYDYYGTMLMQGVGGIEWKRWSDTMWSKLSEHQETGGNNSGSWWFGEDAGHVSNAGRVGVTSFCLLILNELDGANARQH